MVVLRRRRLVRTSENVSAAGEVVRAVHTGGFSSASCPGVGFALRFAHTPPLPPPYTRPLLGACVLKTGISVTLLWMPGGAGSSSDRGFPRINRCLSSRPSSSSSSSESESNVSARVRSSSLATGSSASSRRVAPPVGEDARERKDGGGEAGGHCCSPCDTTGESASSFPATCWSLSVCIS
jgi:hypothetical protein